MVSPIKIHLGCGRRHLEGFINIDAAPQVQPAIVASGEHIPLKSGSVDHLYTSHVIEHIHDFTGVMQEIHRVLKPGGTALIRVPHATTPSSSHPHHVHNFSRNSFDPFQAGDARDYYYRFHFTSVKTRLTFLAFNNIISPFANRFPYFYENSFLAFLFPPAELVTILTK